MRLAPFATLLLALLVAGCAGLPHSGTPTPRSDQSKYGP
jgi:hypothetical protein